MANFHEPKWKKKRKTWANDLCHFITELRPEVRYIDMRINWTTCVAPKCRQFAKILQNKSKKIKLFENNPKSKHQIGFDAIFADSIKVNRFDWWSCCLYVRWLCSFLWLCDFEFVQKWCRSLVNDPLIVIWVTTAAGFVVELRTWSYCQLNICPILVSSGR